VGKERGYLLSEEVEQVLPAELHSTEEIDDLLSTFERIGISLYEDLAGLRPLVPTVDPIVSESPAAGLERQGRAAEEGELDLTPGMLDKNKRSSPPLPAGNGFCSAAEASGRGGHRQTHGGRALMVLKSISRSPIVLKELINVGEELRNGTLSIKKIIQFDQEELTKKKLRIRHAKFFESLGRSNNFMAQRSSRRLSSSGSEG